VRKEFGKFESDAMHLQYVVGLEIQRIRGCIHYKLSVVSSFYVPLFVRQLIVLVRKAGCISCRRQFLL
jgi:hypothetical protein